MVRGNIHELALVTSRPIRAAKSRTRQANGCASNDNSDNKKQTDLGQNIELSQGNSGHFGASLPFRAISNFGG
jgi:hypothetical protein